MGTMTEDGPTLREGTLLFKLSDPYQEFRVGTTHHGWLQCDYSVHKSDTWCGHMETVVTNHLDAGLIWENEPKGSNLPEEEVTVVVPFVPTASQFAEVDLIYSPNVDAYKAYFVSELVGSKNGTLDDLVFLGFLNRGEGRAVLRGMLYAWYQALVTQVEIECKHPGHNFAAQMMWERDMKSTKQVLAQHWSVINTGKCISCSSGASDDFSDVVPESEGRKW